MPGAFAEEGSPSRFVMAWHGQISNIPAGWALCDGNNGTPNLLDRFIISSASKSSSTGSTTGSHTNTLSSSNLPEHSHSGGTTTDGSHSHDFYYLSSETPGYDSIQWTDYDSGSSTGPDTNSAGSHSHAVTDLASAGSGQSMDIRPQYYELAFIAPI